MENQALPVAIIPARGGSKRIPRKNVVMVGDKPLLAYPIETCLAAQVFSEVVVSTEDEEIAAIARSFGAKVEMRPEELARDTAPAALACKDLLLRRYTDALRPEFFCMVYPMAVLIEPDDLRNSMLKLDKCDGVLGVSDFSIHPYKALMEKNGYLTAIWPEKNLQQSQNYPRAVGSNGTFYWGRTEAFMHNTNFYPDRLCAHVIPPWRAVDVDTPRELEHLRRIVASNAQPR